MLLMMGEYHTKYLEQLTDLNKIYSVVSYCIITLDNKFQHFFVSLVNTLLIYLFASMKLETGHKKDYLALV